jgi:tRNA threonylcarbamoyladenosine biosynthesis protein TsaB
VSLILSIETATTVCSASLSREGKLIALKELDNGYTHAENLHVFIDQLLKESNLSAKELSAIAVSKGPGSYTGLRIGVSAAKGLAYALKIPLIAIDTLQIMAAAAKELDGTQDFYCPMIDARRMEVYTCVYNHLLNPVTTVEALIIDETSSSKFKAYQKLAFFGNGMPKCREQLGSINVDARFIENIAPSAKYMCHLAFEKFKNVSFEDVAYFEPYYLKDFMITSARK